MGKILYKIKRILKTILLIFKIAKKVYKTGGYSLINVSSINYGKILQGKKILVTGGSSGIGLSIAKKCLKEGATVLITGRNEIKLKNVVKTINNPLLNMLVWDISQIVIGKEKIKEAKELLGGEIDILVNNAGIINNLDFPDVTEELWDKTYSINSKGTFFLTQLLCRQWIKEDGIGLKKIINISSQGGFVGATYPYRMTKWDIAGLTQGLGIKLAPLGIIVNGIAPGVISTSMQKKCLEQKENVYSSINPINRYALPQEIAELAIFLMSNSSNFIVGQTIVCDGGYSLK